MLALKHNPQQMLALAESISSQKLSVRQAEVLIRKKKASLEAAPQEHTSLTPQIKPLNSKIEQKIQSLIKQLKTPINLCPSNPNSDQGQLIIGYKNLDQLESILKKLCDSD